MKQSPQISEDKDISLVLGSGGAKGMTHVGVIRCLEDHGFNIQYIAGSSIGAIVGGIYAAGKLDAFADWASALRKINVLRLFDFSFGKGGIFRGDRIIETFRNLVGDYQIEDLEIGYTAVATDIFFAGKRREVWLNEGCLFDAMRASMAIPGFFSPVLKHGQVLVDGGIINPVPVAPTLNDSTALTIAVNLNGQYDLQLNHKKDNKNIKSVDGLIANTYQKSIGQFIENLWQEDSEPDGIRNEGLSLIDVMIRSMEVTQSALTQFKLAGTVPTHIIEMPTNLCNFLDFHRSSELIDYGYTKTEELIKTNKL